MCNTILNKFYSVFLIGILSMYAYPLFGQTDKPIQNPESVYVYSKASYYLAKVLEPMGKKTKVQCLDGSAKKEIFTVKSENVFNIRMQDDKLTPEVLRFRITDDELMDDVIVKGTVLGYNRLIFLLEYHYNNEQNICTKHKGEIVQKDLK